MLIVKGRLDHTLRGAFATLLAFFKPEEEPKVDFVSSSVYRLALARLLFDETTLVLAAEILEFRLAASVTPDFVAIERRPLTAPGLGLVPDSL